MKVAYFSPLTPQKSGISDYSEELLVELSKMVEIDLFISDYIPDSEYLRANFNIYPITEFNENLYKSYDEVIYHIGNNTQFHKEIYLTALKYPGITVLHDYSIHHLIANLTVGNDDWDAYIREMEYNYGSEGASFARLAAAGKMRVMWETDKTLLYPANKRIVDVSKGVIVHSKLAEEGIKRVKEDAYVQYVPLFTSDISPIDCSEKERLRDKYNISKESLVFASFGFVSSAKRIHSVLAAIKDLSQSDPDIIYLVVGEEEKGVYEISKQIKSLGLEKQCRFVGFVTLDEFKEYIKLTDVCINLRYPTQGETSASLLRILGYGKPALVSNIGSFAEFPDDFTIKINCGDDALEQAEIREAINTFMKDRSLVGVLGSKASAYVSENHTVSDTALRYLQAIKNLNANRAFNNEARFYYSYLDRYVDRCRGILEFSDKYQVCFAEHFSKFLNK